MSQSAIARSAILFLLLSTVLLAQPDPRQMSGLPLPTTDLPDRTVSVRLIRGALTNNILNHPVELLGAGDPRRANSDASGRAIFPDLPEGASVRAVTTVDGERLQSQTFQVPARGGIRLMLVASAAAGQAAPVPGAATRPRQPGAVAFGGESRIVVEISEGALNVFYLLDVVNNRDAPADNGGPISIELPEGASGAATMQGSSPQATVNGPRVTIVGPFAPGRTPVHVGFALPYSSGSTTLSQRMPIPLLQLAAAVQKVGAMRIESAQFAQRREVSADGRTFVVASGAAIGAGQTLSIALGGLPHHSLRSAYIALSVAVAIIVAGGWAAFSASRTPARSARRKALEVRRERLYADLVAFERRRRADTAELPENDRGRPEGLRDVGTPPDHALRARLYAELVEVHEALDVSAPA